ncbi:hypothetical protein FJD32_000600 [Shewanella sp. LC6]|uniref:Inner membrane protein n=2 Tax=Shewanellaceae TaxID=267890 RepID=A0A5B8R490_9GAMM|nr:hypothetical protein CEQ32_16690 [Shewanella sp. FDAARGOS_354]MBW0279340.1 hypothetical protein [Shewanella xiamenensis]NSM25635.1 hypothetical protein [Shewanella sp. ZOR0012]PZP37773.1 MAG: hypothetical protein DI594_02105 [Shewanella oneidensis]QDZ93137.1 hypothetical protein D0436_00645 [Shewanella decolorationis]QQK62080.1 hypothetical protein FJD32_000600 [Shewanella sp. LC6]TPE65521.1 hypothetical protein FJD33_00315 [Shewanella sp. LC2]
MRLFMKYLPALGLGILLAVLSFTSFALVASAGYMHALLGSVDNLSPTSPVYLGLAAHDAGLLLLLSGLMLFSYQRLFPRLPFDWYTAVAMQMPLGLLVLWADGVSFNLTDFYGVARALTLFSAAFGVLIIFGLLQRRGRRLAQA